MSLSKKLFYIGGVLLGLPLLLFLVRAVFLSCAEFSVLPGIFGPLNHTLHVLVDHHFSLFLLLAWAGFSTLTASFFAWRLSKEGTHWMVALVETTIMFMVVLFMVAVLLASMSSARSKGPNAAAISAILNSRAQAELYFNDHDSYEGLCASAEMQGYFQTIKMAPIKNGSGLLCTELVRSVDCRDGESGFAIVTQSLGEDLGQNQCVDAQRDLLVTIEGMPNDMVCDEATDSE